MKANHTVHVVDDEEHVRDSTVFLLEMEKYSAKSWPHAEAFLEAVSTERSGCALVDVRMPEIDGLELQRRLSESGIAMPVIIMTGHADVAIAVRAMKEGAFDFIEKPFEPQVLFRSIEAALSNAVDRAAIYEKRMEAERLVGMLSNRERDVLVGLTRGNPNKYIAYDLGISPRTVEIHRANLMAKLRTRNLSDTLRIAFAAGIGVDSVSN